MITMSIAISAGIFYWLGSYQLAFWILVYAIVYGGLGVLRGDNHASLLYRRDSGIITAALVPVAWHIGTCGLPLTHPAQETGKIVGDVIDVR